MPFIAVCPKCESRLRAPKRKRGTSQPCPNCQEVFELFPQGHRESAEREAAASAVPPPSPGPTASVATPRVPTVAATEEPDDAFAMALVGLGFFGAAVIAAQFPYGRIIGLVLAGIGLIVAGLSLLGLEKRAWIGWLGTGGNSLVALFLVLLPGWIGVATWSPSGDPNSTPMIPLALDRTGKPVAVTDGVDPTNADWQHVDVRIAIPTAVIAPDPNAKLVPGQKSKNRVLRIAVKLTNIGVGRVIEFAGWDAENPIQIKTTSGQYLQLRTDIDPVKRALVYPGKSIEFVLTFDAAPLAPTDGVNLELPAKAFGGDTPAKFRIPRTMIR